MTFLRDLLILVLLPGLLPSADPALHRGPAVLIAPPWAAAVGDDRFGRWADLVVDGVHQRLRWIEPGSFIMGCFQAERDDAIRGGAHPDWVADEVPHRVTLTRGFWLADSPCTQEMWEAVMGSDPALFQGDPQRPVDSVSFEDCQWFLAVLNALAHARFTLPTEAQREYACRAGTVGAYAGPDLAACGWYRDNSGRQSHPVKRKQPNPWGLHDLHGNVWEWCLDWYAAYPSSAMIDPQGPDAGIYRVRRGGSWSADAGSCRSAYRGGDVPTVRSDGSGFRLCVQCDAVPDATAPIIPAVVGDGAESGLRRTQP